MTKISLTTNTDPSTYLHCRIYKNQGNIPLLDLINDCKRVLDVGCGAGDNAFLIRERFPSCEIYGITHSGSEADIACQYMTDCWVLDLEGDLPLTLTGQKLDTLVFFTCSRTSSRPCSLTSEI